MSADRRDLRRQLLDRVVETLIVVYCGGPSDDEQLERALADEIHYEPHDIPISRACTLVWYCTDIVPGSLFDGLVTEGLDPKRRTYAACARVILADIKSKRQVAA